MERGSAPVSGQASREPSWPHSVKLVPHPAAQRTPGGNHCFLALLDQRDSDKEKKTFLQSDFCGKWQIEIPVGASLAKRGIGLAKEFVRVFPSQLLEQNPNEPFGQPNR